MNVAHGHTRVMCGSLAGSSACHGASCSYMRHSQFMRLFLTGCQRWLYIIGITLVHFFSVIFLKNNYLYQMVSSSPLITHGRGTCTTEERPEMVNVVDTAAHTWGCRLSWLWFYLLHAGVRRYLPYVWMVNDYRVTCMCSLCTSSLTACTCSPRIWSRKWADRCVCTPVLVHSFWKPFTWRKACQKVRRYRLELEDVGQLGLPGFYG